MSQKDTGTNVNLQLVRNFIDQRNHVCEEIKMVFNKIELFLLSGMDVENKKKMIGFRLSSYAAGSTAVGPIDHLCHIPQRMKTAIKVYEYCTFFKLELECIYLYCCRY